MGSLGWIVTGVVLLLALSARCDPCATWRWLRVLWVCRIPALGVLAGAFLLVYTEQGRDLFSDLGLSCLQWLLFFGLVLGWAWIVHAIARCAVQYDDWVPEAHVGHGLLEHRREELRREYYCPALLIPRALGLLVFVSVAGGMVRALLNVLDAAPDLPEASEAKWQTIRLLVFHEAGPGLLEVSEAKRLIIWLLVATVIVAAAYLWLVHNRTRFLVWFRKKYLPVDLQDPDYYPLLNRTVPLEAVLDLWKQIAPLRWLLCVLFAIWLILWRLVGLICYLVRPLGRRLERWLCRPLAAPGACDPAQPAAPVKRVRATGIVVAFFAAGIVFWSALILALWNPTLLADWLPRALFVPLFISLFVLATGWIAAWSHRLRTPLLIVVLGVATFLVYWFDHFHDVRWVGPPQGQAKAVGPSQQIAFSTAVTRWKERNKCVTAADKAARPPDECRPIIIAGAGGASRAGFFTATVVGALIDLGVKQPEKYGNLRDRIFAMSTVSGGSVGAVVMRAALSDALDDGAPNTPPCRTPGGRAWFGATARLSAGAPAGYNPKESWRDCFQQLLAGDFLSPVFVGIAFRDSFPLGNPITGRAAWGDRAALLEQGFERHYYDITGKGAQTCGEDATAVQTGMCRRLGYHPDPKSAGAWLPLLFINGTSVATGRRIIVGDIGAGEKIGDAVANNDALYKLAYDFTEMRGSLKGGPNEDPLEKNSDLFLSTTATMSARFPIISPHGVLRGRSGSVVDRVVDGGYFENDGLATAADLVHALRHEGLEPIVIRIVNDPTDKPSQDARRPAVPDDSESQPFEGSLSIVRALTATRSGHEDASADYLRGELGDASRLLEIGVHPLTPGTGPLCRREITAGSTMKSVSMSWWMSQPVQAYLDAQLCTVANWKSLECHLRARRPAEPCP